MTRGERLERYGVALLATRMSVLGDDPCGGSEVVLWEDVTILKGAGIHVRVYGRAVRNDAPVNVIRLRTSAPLITSLEYGGQFLIKEPHALLISYNEPMVAGWAPERTITRFDWSTALPGYWKWPMWQQRFQRALYLFPSGSERELFFHHHSQIPRDSTAVLPNAVDLELFKPTDAVAEKKLQVGFAGQWVPGKGIAELLDAWRIVKSNQPAAELYLAGGPDLWKGVKVPMDAEKTAACVRAMERDGLVHSVGSIPRAQMPQFWHSMSVAVVPSLHESFGLVALEALACGVPVVATTAGGLKEIVVDEESGLLVPPGDAAALTRALLRLLTNEPVRVRLAEGARRRAQAFSLERRSHRLLELLQGRIEKAA